MAIHLFGRWENAERNCFQSMREVAVEVTYLTFPNNAKVHGLRLTIANYSRVVAFRSVMKKLV